MARVGLVLAYVAGGYWLLVLAVLAVLSAPVWLLAGLPAHPARPVRLELVQGGARRTRRGWRS